MRKWDVNIRLPPPKAQRSLWKRGEKELRVRVGGWLRRNCLLDTDGHIWGHNGCDSVHETSVSSSQTKSQHRHGSWAGCPTLELLTSVSCWKKERQFSPKVKALVSWPHSSGKAHVYEYWGSTNRSWWVNKNAHKLGGGEWGWILLQCGWNSQRTNKLIKIYIDEK